MGLSIVDFEKSSEFEVKNGSKGAHQGSILVVDDDMDLCGLLMDLLTEEGYDVESVQNGDEAIARFKGNGYDLLLSDIKMPGLSGLDLLQEIKKIRPEQTLIMITAFGTVETAIEAMKLGAIDYIIKPFKSEELTLIVQKAFEQIRLHKEVLRLRQEVAKEYQFSNIIGKSKAMQRVYHLIRRVSASAANILLSGESGTGKELVAKALHYNSMRKDRPFVAVNCAAIPGQLLESELFGHVRGAFTDAHCDKKGMFEEANGGTLFLDEIDGIALDLQPKLLRAIQEKTIRRVGSTKTISVDIRIISATNRNLMDEVHARHFRDDLYYRVNVIELEIPPLRKRREDIPLLVDFFLNRYAVTWQKQISGVTETAMTLLMNYAWPGNVRELESVIERAVTLAPSNRITADDLPPSLTGTHSDQLLLDQMLSRLCSVEELEREYIQRVLQLVGGNKLKAAQILQIDRKTLYRKIESFQEKQPLPSETD